MIDIRRIIFDFTLFQHQNIDEIGSTIFIVIKHPVFCITSIRPTYTYVKNPFTGLRNYPSIFTGCVSQVLHYLKQSLLL